MQPILHRSSRIRGEIPAIRLCPTFEAQQNVVSVDSWGDIEWKSMHAFAKDCKNLDKLPKYAPNLSKVTDASQMFEDAHAFDQPLNNWNVSSVQNMNMMFMHASSFSYYPENWIVPKGQAEAMFHYTKVEKLANEKPLKARD